MSERIATVTRDTKETQITVTVNLDGEGRLNCETGVPFLDHMLDQVARHGLIDLDIKAVGDLHIVIDFSGRPGLFMDVEFTRASIGRLDTQLFWEFFQGFVNHARVTLHIDNLKGFNAHHQAETIFKAFGRALRMAVEPDPRMAGQMPSTKGCL